MPQPAESGSRTPTRRSACGCSSSRQPEADKLSSAVTLHGREIRNERGVSDLRSFWIAAMADEMGSVGDVDTHCAGEPVAGGWDRLHRSRYGDCGAAGDRKGMVGRVPLLPTSAHPTNALGVLGSARA